MSTVAEEISNILFDSLKIQAERYKTIMDSESLTHEQRKEFDTEIKQMYQLLSEMTQTSTVYTLAEIKALKIQYEAKILELQKTLDNLNVTVVKGENGKDGQNGLDGKSLTFDMLTTEQKQELKGADGQNGKDGQNGLDGKDGVNGLDGKSLTYADLTDTQKQQIAKLLILQPVLTRLDALENKIANLESSIIPDNSNDILITSFASEKSNFKYFADFDYVVPDNVENVWKVYKMKDNIFNISNSYVLTYRFKINSLVFDLVYDMTYVNNSWEVISRTNSNTILEDSLWFNGGVQFNADNLFLDFTFDSANGNFIPALDVALFVQCDNTILDLVCLESSSDDAVVSSWLP